MQRSDEVLREGKVQRPKAPAVPLRLACGERRPSFKNTHRRSIGLHPSTCNRQGMETTRTSSDRRKDKEDELR